jgi:hypothetical protein
MAMEICEGRIVLLLPVLTEPVIVVPVYDRMLSLAGSRGHDERGSRRCETT